MLSSAFSRIARQVRARVSGPPGQRPGPDDRRRFIRRASSPLNVAAMLTDEAWSAAEARAAQFGIAPGTTVDAQGRPAQARDTTPFVGEILLTGYNFAMRGFALCEGQILAINANQALFSLLGTLYGGDGRTTFGLPDLRGRLPMGMGAGPGLSNRPIGQKVGAEQFTVTPQHLASHAHSIPAIKVAGTSRSPTDNVPAGTASENSFAPAPATVQMQPTATTGTPSPVPSWNLSPVLGLNYQISLEGTYPSRS